MTSLRGDRLIGPKDRLHDTLWNFLVLADAIGIASAVVFGTLENRQFFQSASGGFACRQFPVNVKVPAEAPFPHAITSSDSEEAIISIGFEVMPGGRVLFPPGIKRILTKQVALTNIIGRLVALGFISFYERYRPWIQQTYGRDIEKWDELIRFCWAMRNAAVHHDGKIHITDEARRPVVWHHLKFGVDDKDTQVLNGVLGAGDLLVLMFEFSDFLDSKGCPVET